MNVQNICRGEDYRPIFIDVFDWNRTQADRHIGTCSTCFADLKRASQDCKSVVLALYETQFGNRPKYRLRGTAG